MFDCLFSQQRFCQKLLRSNRVCKDYSKSNLWDVFWDTVYIAVRRRLIGNHMWPSNSATVNDLEVLKVTVATWNFLNTMLWKYIACYKLGRAYKQIENHSWATILAVIALFRDSSNCHVRLNKWQYLEHTMQYTDRVSSDYMTSNAAPFLLTLDDLRFSSLLQTF